MLYIVQKPVLVLLQILSIQPVIAAEVLKKAGVYIMKLFGVTTLDIIRAETRAAEMKQAVGFQLLQL